MEPAFDRAAKMADTQLTKLRWALGLNGLLAIAVGVVILIWPGISLFALTILFGADSLATGVVGLGAAFRALKGERGWLIFRLTTLDRVVLASLRRQSVSTMVEPYGFSWPDHR